MKTKYTTQQFKKLFFEIQFFKYNYFNIKIKLIRLISNKKTTSRISDLISKFFLDTSNFLSIQNISKRNGIYNYHRSKLKNPARVFKNEYG